MLKMIPFHTLIVVTLLVVGCSSSRVERRTYTVEGVDPQSNLKSTIDVYRDRAGREVCHGKYMLWYPSGSKYWEAEFKEGRPDGLCRIFDRNGNVAVQGSYRDGRPWNGTFQVGHEIQTYTNGILVGSPANR